MPPSALQRITSRTSRRQVMVFLPPPLAGRLLDRAGREGKTVQQILGEALNAGCAERGRGRPLDTRAQRLIRRSEKTAGVRTANAHPPCRAGRKAVSGWYDIRQVEEVNRVARDAGVTLQDFASWSVRLFLVAGQRVEDGRAAA